MLGLKLLSSSCFLSSTNSSFLKKMEMAFKEQWTKEEEQDKVSKSLFFLFISQVRHFLDPI